MEVIYCFGNWMDFAGNWRWQTLTSSSKVILKPVRCLLQSLIINSDHMTVSGFVSIVKYPMGGADEVTGC
jgi:hypothetical protein